MEIDNYDYEQMLNEKETNGHFMKAGKTVDFEKVFNFIKNNNVLNCDIGLMEDWSCTAGPIISDGKTESEEMFYGGSSWATPVLMDDTGEIHEIWRFVPYGSKIKFEIPLWFRIGILGLNLQRHQWREAEEILKFKDQIKEQEDKIINLLETTGEELSPFNKKLYELCYEETIAKITKIEEILDEYYKNTNEDCCCCSL